MAALTRWVLRHRRLVVLGWLVCFLFGGAASARLSNRMSFDFSLPGQSGFVAASRILRIYGNGGEQEPAITVVTVPPGQTVRGDATAIGTALGTVQAHFPQIRVVDYATTSDPLFLTRDGRSTFALMYEPPPHGFSNGPSVSASRELAGLLPQDTVRLTGLNALASSGTSTGPGILLETVVGGAGALAVLGFVFGSFLALLPLLIAAVAITTTLLVIFGLTFVGHISFIAQYIVALIGLGVAIDYSLLIVTRWREERAHGSANPEAVTAAMQTAGRAVLFSGATVAIGLFALVALPVPFLRSIGVAGLLIPLVSVLAALTLLPALLGSVGPRVDWPRLRNEAMPARGWSAWARLVVRHRVPAALFATAVLAALFVPFLGARIGIASSASLARSGPAYDGLQTLVHGGVPDGVLTPIEVLTSTPGAAAAVDRLRTVPGVADAVAPRGPAANRAGTTVVVAVPDQETVNHGSIGPVVRAEQALRAVPGVLGVSGVGALQLDYTHAVYDNMPLMIGLVVVVTFLLLARAFRSLLLPAKAVVLNLLSVAATFGAVVLFWQDGHGSQQLFSIHATGAITFWQPIMIFAFLFGLSMDYEVFILIRMREEAERSGSTTTAVVRGLGRTGRLVTSAALILFLAFASLASAPQTDIKVFATALGVGILLDATVVRALLVPALVALFGRWNWWLPGWAARLMRVPQSTVPTVPELERVAAG